jgi:RNA-splicing ligase RtcB
MISIELSPDIEKQFNEIVRDVYGGNSQNAIVTLLKLHRKYGWKEQLRQNVESVRAEVHRKGGVRSEDIENAIKRYRKTAVSSDA